MIAAVTDLDGSITGAHRTWLDPVRRQLGKAPIDYAATGHGPSSRALRVRFGVADDVWRPAKASRPCCRFACVLPDMPMAAALSANHLAAILFPPTLRRLYVVRDNDPAGDGAMATV